MNTPEGYIVLGQPMSDRQKTQVIELLKVNEPIFKIYALIQYLETTSPNPDEASPEPTAAEEQLFNLYRKDALYILNLVLGQLIANDLLPAVPEAVAVSPEARRLALAYQV